uniref:SCAN box domain-containing protein n=1 Tax=Poecilia mexicana TaxID=48701 RepID=A0A3B3XHV5_9TELE
MAQFNLEEFLSNPTVEQFDVCRKDDLYEIASYLGIHVSKSLLKRELKSVVFSSLVEKGILAVDKEETTFPGSPDHSEVCAEEGRKTPPAAAKPEGDKPPASIPRFEPFSIESSNPSVEERLKVRLVRLELEAKERERKDEFEFQLKCRQIEAETAIKMRQLELQSQKPTTVPTTDSGGVEDNVSISPDAPSYSLAPSTFDISKNIALVPPFRETEVEAYFNAFERIAVALHWPTDVWSLLLQCKLIGKAQEVCAALTIEDSLVYDKVKAAILRAYELVPEAYRQRFRALRKSTAQTFVEFAREKGMLFDRWCQATKATDFSSLGELILLEEFKNCLPDRTVLYLNEQKATTLQEAAVLAEEFALTHKNVFVCKSDQPSRDKTWKEVPQSQVKNTPISKSERQCFYCHKMGNIVSDCLALKRKQAPQPPKPAKGVGLVKTLRSSPDLSNLSEPDDCFKPFIFDGLVSLTGCPEDEKPVRILRDTGGSQSFILSSLLPFNADTSCNASTIVQGIGMAYVPAPLHHVHIKSKLASGLFKVAVRNSFPVQGVEFIMGNDLAGDKVLPIPEMVDNPSCMMGEDEMLKSHPDVFAVSALTRSQAHKLKEVNLDDSVLGSALMEDKLPAEDSSESAPIKDNFTPKTEVFLPPSISCESLSQDQKSDGTLIKCFEGVSDSINGDKTHKFYVDNGLLMRKWISRPALQQKGIEE